MTAPAAPAAPAPAAPRPGRRPRRGARVVRIAFAVVLAAQTVLMLGQPVLAGMFLAGDYDALTTHGNDGNYLGGTVVLLLLLAVALWLLRGASGRLPLVVLGLTVAVGLQIHLGWVRTVLVHVPLGIASIGVDLALVAWTVRRTRRSDRKEAIR